MASRNRLAVFLLRFKRIACICLPALLLLSYLMINDYLKTLRALPLQYSGAENYKSEVEYAFTEQDLNKRINFTTEGNDVMVFLHMQKTGGTFLGKNLVKNLRLNHPCTCTKGDGMLKCPCMSSDNKRYWLFSRYSTGWKCGLHADFTELHECLAAGKLNELEGSVRPRRYYYISMLREPLQRYVSEWLHVARGASWITATLRCNGKSPSLNEAPYCYSGDSWANVTLNEFLSCPYNLARNRQTRMLANLTEIGCYSKDMMDNPHKKKLLIESAKKNLRALSYFALMQYLEESQQLFEWTFGLTFKGSMIEQRNRHNRNSADVLASLPEYMKQKIATANDLDIELYNYAHQLFLQRFEYAKQHKFRRKL